MLYMTKPDYEKLLNYCIGELPAEACGLIGGVKEADAWYVKRIYLLTNIEQDAVHFSMEPAEQFAAVRDMRGHGLELLGNFHSHPNASARMSAEDIRFAGDSNLLYLILSLADRQHPELRAFQGVDSKHITEDGIIIK